MAEDAGGCRLGVVSHEAEDEGVRGWLDENTGKGSVEEEARDGLVSGNSWIGLRNGKTYGLVAT